MLHQIEQYAQLPVNSPLLLMTRWAGTPSADSFIIQPTIRAPRGYPMALASQPSIATQYAFFSWMFPNERSND
jgi:hypothetical protein